MKNKNFNLINSVKALFLAAFITFNFASCSNDETTSNDTTASKLTIKETLDAFNRAPAPGNTSIAGVAVGAGFNELVSALVYVDTELNTQLVNLFANGTDQYTVFAPTDQAFQNLYAALNVTSITELPAPLVRDVLLYHVTDGRRAANSVVPKNGMRTITTLLSSQFYVLPNGSINAIGNTANITTANISASNGIIHVIDAVLLPIN
ncbi:fasciclin domain-containing protein [Flavobacterium capsici]|uniref:Fasciclin domain-containing protein n=1 Tax=Flavobacterium capsici TaxID=3075618 RepID=A0AA96EWJ3_9FLAO|nr:MULTISPECIES: fasciclin domain-containing protein [unclassified Flavobacterium]WNM19342.1 fasciclin domain-containing protein [Flavobacterium sp. PMR2A8]WNM20731.1 fasciclin domain-containing protein [Flavobacterium sp. PMTSA4]